MIKKNAIGIIIFTNPLYLVGNKLPYDKLPYDKLPYDKLPYDKLPYDKLPYDKLPYDKLPYDKLPYDKHKVKGINFLSMIKPYHST